jgi:hypothetical protein
MDTHHQAVGRMVQEKAGHSVVFPPQQQGRVAATPWNARSGISWTVFGRRMGIPASTLFSALDFSCTISPAM